MVHRNSYTAQRAAQVRAMENALDAAGIDPNTVVTPDFHMEHDGVVYRVMAHGHRDHPRLQMGGDHSLYAAVAKMLENQELADRGLLVGFVKEG
jgi:hypothetical protein